jgi:hypothetical protein
MRDGAAALLRRHEERRGRRRLGGKERRAEGGDHARDQHRREGRDRRGRDVPQHIEQLHGEEQVAPVEAAGRPGEKRRADADREREGADQLLGHRQRHAEPVRKRRQHARHHQRPGADDEVAEAQRDEAASRASIGETGIAPGAAPTGARCALPQPGRGPRRMDDGRVAEREAPVRVVELGLPAVEARGMHVGKDALAHLVLAPRAVALD